MKKHRKLAVCAVCAAAGMLVAVFAIRGGKPPAASIEAVGFFTRCSEESFNACEYAAENGAEALMELFDSLREYVDANGLTDEEVHVLLTNISGLDGAYTETYGALLRAARNSDPDGFDAAVNALHEARRQELLPLLD